MHVCNKKVSYSTLFHAGEKIVFTEVDGTIAGKFCFINALRGSATNSDSKSLPHNYGSLLWFSLVEFPSGEKILTFFLPFWIL